jgi:small-conductance mechanosensitive channel
MSTQGFDASSIKRSTWIAGGGAIVLLISTFVSWWKVTVVNFDITRSGWDTGALGKLVFLVALVAIVLVVVDHMKVDLSQLPIPVSLALLGLGALALLLVIIRYIDTPDGVDRAWGIYLAFIAAAVLTYGGWLKLQED